MSLIHMEPVKYCTYSGDPGCLGWPDWHKQDCIYVEEARTFCSCGGNDVYGEMWHEESCPLFEQMPLDTEEKV